MNYNREPFPLEQLCQLYFICVAVLEPELGGFAGKWAWQIVVVVLWAPRVVRFYWREACTICEILCDVHFKATGCKLWM